MNPGIALWPPAASAYAHKVDVLFAGFSALVLMLTVPVFVLLVVFAVRYRRGRPADRSRSASGNTCLETSWAVIPFLLTLGFFGYATWLYLDEREAPPDALEIHAVGRQWMWKFEHPGGQREINELHVPAGQPVRVVLSSQDVIHSLYLPALRLKQDAVPGRYTSLWFTADRPGTYALRCAEFCGTDHAVMGGRFIVMDGGEYARWLEQSGTEGSLAAQGAVLFRDLGCSGCHTPGSSRRAPSLEGVYGRPTPLDDGRVVIADDQYLHDSILYPHQAIAAGYAPIMPTFAGQVSEAELMRLVAYLKSLTTPEADG